MIEYLYESRRDSAKNKRRGEISAGTFSLRLYSRVIDKKYKKTARKENVQESNSEKTAGKISERLELIAKP